MKSSFWEISSAVFIVRFHFLRDQKVMNLDESDDSDVVDIVENKEKTLSKIAERSEAKSAKRSFASKYC